ncbi:hypothetical protein GCM10023194_05180 [Planotetraspora phitsanulokensis]|uniref:Uncharacterized protein n=1 Tax=Planotetraspora phitsanulokensis TaxID=575192 RepID=A0A8J3UAM9_9ACTN|nr:hypothetical protein Pph01_40170 [Planotetraspora phitsanulokensis]
MAGHAANEKPPDHGCSLWRLAVHRCDRCGRSLGGEAAEAAGEPIGLRDVIGGQSIRHVDLRGRRACGAVVRVTHNPDLPEHVDWEQHSHPIRQIPTYSR